MTMPVFSIIIPTYNRANFLPQTMDSILKQTYPYFEIIIVDDGSTDNTENIVTSIHSEKIKYYKLPTNRERGYARNFGAKLAKGDYLYFHDSDDILYSHHLESAQKILKDNPYLPVFHLGYEVLTSKKKIKQAGYKNVNALLIQGNILSCHGVFIRRDIFLQHLFNEDRTMAGLEDWELWLRLAPHFEIKHFPEITSAIIQHSNRSVLHTNPQKLLKRVETFMNYVLSNSDITTYYANQLHHFKASCYTYSALHLALTKKHKKTTLYYLFKGLKEKPTFIFYRRFWAILKHLLL